MGKPLTEVEMNTLLYFYDGLGFSTDLIEYLVEHCVSNNHKNMRYIEKVALAWADKNIFTVKDAKKKMP
jgi:DnaD/phage-associated family protein